ncbi:hypothetical protein HJFPF1_03013 [Paramyrothecium foliicola]|nr:hypothetical protein HJFPF1_03013 [Paramyrothecium foliicola]
MDSAGLAYNIGRLGECQLGDETRRDETRCRNRDTAPIGYLHEIECNADPISLQMDVQRTVKSSSKARDLHAAQDQGKKQERMCHQITSSPTQDGQTGKIQLEPKRFSA